MTVEAPPRPRMGLFLLFLVCGMSVVALAVSGVLIGLGIPVLAVAFLVVALRLRKSENHRDLWPTFFAFFIFAFVFPVRFILVGFVAQLAPLDSLAGVLLIPIALFLSVVVTIVVLTKVSGGTLSSLYVKRGDLRLGTLVGSVALIVLYAGAVVGFLWAFGASRGVTFGQLLSLTPAVLWLSVWNAPNEELWFRGLFLRKWEPYVGKKYANLLQAPMFALGHYVPEFTRFGSAFIVAFLALAFVAALGFAYVIQRTDSLLAATLAHIGADVPIYLAVLLGVTAAGV